MAFCNPVSPKKTKYGNKRCELDGIKFASKKEMNRYCELKMLERTHKILRLECHPVFYISNGCTDPATGRKMRKLRYTADFMYIDNATGATIVEEVKSPATRKETAYRMRRQLFLEQYGHDHKFLEV